ncbi:hypothetical protein AAHB49_16275 [Bacillus cereus]
MITTILTEVSQLINNNKDLYTEITSKKGNKGVLFEEKVSMLITKVIESSFPNHSSYQTGAQTFPDVIIKDKTSLKEYGVEVKYSEKETGNRWGTVYSKAPK